MRTLSCWYEKANEPFVAMKPIVVNMGLNWGTQRHKFLRGSGQLRSTANIINIYESTGQLTLQNGPNKKKEKQMLKRELLHADTINENITELASCYNARGQYVPMHFVLKLRPDIHKKLENINNGISPTKNFDFDTLQAFSTYLHETIHWWQHIGSTSGFTLTMSHPSQTHINTELLKSFTKTSGKIKSVLA